jgi:DNA-binding XRE family transcriptional regulator
MTRSKPKPKASRRRKYVSQSELARRFGVTRGTIKRWEMQGLFPTQHLVRSGHSLAYDLEAYDAWNEARRAHERKMSENHAKMQTLKVELLELELAERRGEILRKDCVDDEMRRVVYVAYHRLLAVLGRVAPLVIRLWVEEIKQVLKREEREALQAPHEFLMPAESRARRQAGLSPYDDCDDD